MAGQEERDALLADTGDYSASEDEQTSSMRDIMGFSSFGGPPKPKRAQRGPREGELFSQAYASGANSQPVKSRNTSISTTASSAFSTSHPFIPASLPPRPRARSSIPTPLRISSPPTQQIVANIESPPIHPAIPVASEKTTSLKADTPPFIPEAAHPSPITTDIDTNLNKVAYTNPNSGHQLTARELKAYERGVVQQIKNMDGSMGEVTVYFKPNFVEANPWEYLETAAGLK